LLLTFRLCVVSLSSENRIRLKLPPSSPLYSLSDKLKVDLGKSRRIFIKSLLTTNQFNSCDSVLRIRGGSGAFLDPGLGIRIRIQDPGWKKSQIRDQGSGLTIPDLIFENFVSVFGV
jgi:hypothetical protein